MKVGINNSLIHCLEIQNIRVEVYMWVYVCMGERVRHTNCDGCGRGLCSLHVGMGANTQGVFECGSVQVRCRYPVWVYVGLCPAGLHGCRCPASGPKEKSPKEPQRHQWQWTSPRTKGVLEQHPTVCSRWQAGHGSSSGGAGGCHYGNWRQTDRVTGETSGWGTSSLPLRLGPSRGRSFPLIN